LHKNWYNDRGEFGSLTLVISVVITIIILFGMIAYYNNQSELTPGIKNDQIDAYSFLVFKDADNNTLAKNGNNHVISYKSDDSAEVIQYCINATNQSGGGTIYLKLGAYEITEALNISHANVTLTADVGTVLRGHVLPMLDVYGTTDWWTLNNVHISNLAFIYNGSIEPGCLIRFHYAIAQYYGGGLALTNVQIYNENMASFPTERNFIALLLSDCIGLQVSEFSVYGFGTAVKYINTYHNPPGYWYDGSHNNYQYVTISYCYQGIWYEGSVTNEVWIQLKTQAIARYGIIALSNLVPGELTLIDPQFEDFDGLIAYVGAGNYQCAVELSGTPLIVTNGLFNGGIEYGLRLNDSVATITNCIFNSIDYPIWLSWEKATLTGNSYQAETTITYVTRSNSWITGINDPYVTRSWGYNYTTGAVNTIEIPHGLSVLPTSIVITPSTASFGVYGITSLNMTCFVVWFANQPGADYWGFYWVAEGEAWGN
jgi:hypothetical protein